LNGVIDRLDLARDRLPDPTEGILKNMTKNIQRSAFLMGIGTHAHSYIADISRRYACTVGGHT
jgi:hypothetical protein